MAFFASHSFRRVQPQAPRNIIAHKNADAPFSLDDRRGRGYDLNYELKSVLDSIFQTNFAIVKRL
mgnify:CR=1 FL=1